ncbi:MAG: glycosyltransferase family 1 protein [Gammaproteobacteria bacterium]|nr:glycosyltransferase family 1 protein [Gammaproteobacteria bacterium]
MNAVINDLSREERLKQPDVVVKDDGAKESLEPIKIAPEQSSLFNYKYNQNVTPNIQTPNRRIALITETWPPEINGVAHSIYQLAKGLKANGNTLFLVRPAQSLASDDSLAEQTMLVKGFAIPRYNTLQFGAPAYARLKEFFKQTQPDVVHIVTEGPLGLAALYAARKLGIPVSSGFHSPFHEFSTYFGLSFLLAPIISYLRYFHNRTDVTCVPSEKTVQQLESMGIDRLKVVTRGVDIQRFSPQHRSQELRKSWGAGEQTTVLLYVGRLSPEKNIDLVIAAFRELQIEQSFRAVRLVLVGDGPERQRLEKLGSDVIFAGMRTGNELSQYYASADVFVFASQVETFGNVVPEAMASGLPVLAFNDAAAGQLVDSGKSGWLCPLKDEWHFKQLTAGLPKQIELQDMGKRASQRVQQMGWQHAVVQFEQVLEQVIQQKQLSEVASAGLAADKEEIKE